MAEVFGVVAGVLGLLPLCRDGLSMIRCVFKASDSIELAMDRVMLQQDQYEEWCEIWDSPEGKAARFAEFAKMYPGSARRVLTQLGRLSTVLFDAKALRESYGLKPPPKIQTNEDLEDLGLPSLEKWEHLSREKVRENFTKKCKSNISFIQKCKFVIRKHDRNWNDLIGLLKEYNDNLRTFGPKDDLVRMEKKKFDILNKLSLDGLMRLAAASRYENQVDGHPTVPYYAIETAANFKAAVKHGMGRPRVRKFDMNVFRIANSYTVLSSQSSTMALLWDFPARGHVRVVLIEWIDYSNPDWKKDTETKASMLGAPKPGQLLLPLCYGTVENPIGNRIGLVLAPPEHICMHLPPLLSSGAISRRRMPISLRQLLEQDTPERHLLDLGIRFRLAKQLLDAVHTMHSVGWVHKNIRPGSILFFPAKSTTSPGPVEGETPLLGYDQPYFVGFGRARIDRDIRYHLQSRSAKINDIDLDYYQHPHKRNNPIRQYVRSFDLYSLGCVLLEIGLWEPLFRVADLDMLPDEFAEKIRASAKSCNSITGSIYASVVYNCLTVQPDHPALSDFCAEMAANLDKCVA